MAKGAKHCLIELVKEIRGCNLWVSFVAEFVGTFILVFVGCGSCVAKDWEKDAPTLVQISWTFGLAVATMVWNIAHISGGHINPAVTVAMLVARRVSLVRALLYVLAQSVGAISGAGLLYLVTNDNWVGSLGRTSLNEFVKVEEGLGVEIIITFVLVLTVFATTDANRSDLNGSGPLAIGLSVALCHMFAIKYTGSSMNPARSLGPAVIMKESENHWIYWVGPILGGVLAALLYEFVLAKNASSTKLKAYFSRCDYDSARKFHLQSEINEDEKYSEELHAITKA